MRTETEVSNAIELYSDMVLRLCGVYLKNDTDAEDIFQNVFLKYALRDRPFENAEHEKAWFIRVTVNACKDLLKSFFRTRTVPLTELPDYLSGLSPERLAVLDVTGREYGEAMGRIMVSDELGVYLDAGNVLSITVSGRGAEQTLSRVVCRAYAVAEDDQVFYILADSATVKAAHAEGLSVVQYEALLILRQTDPQADAGQVKAMTMSQIRELIGFERLDDPCGENKEEK